MFLAYEGRHDEAIDQLLRTLTIAPQLSMARTYLVMAYRRRGDLDLAGEHAREVTSPAPGSHGYFGQTLALSGRRDEARPRSNA